MKRSLLHLDFSIRIFALTPISDNDAQYPDVDAEEE